MARACAPHNLFSKLYNQMQSAISNFRKEAYKRGLKLISGEHDEKGHLYKAKPTAPALMEQDIYTA